ncbi:hypothetical protein ABK040_009342 [Willaertia magna]
MNHNQLIQRAKDSVRIPYENASKLVSKQLYSDVLNGIVNNVKMGPFKATSGIELPYYLNASTNFMDKRIAPKIVDLIGNYLLHLKESSPSLKDLPLTDDQPLLCVGMELAGGMLVSQFAACSILHPKLHENFDFLYIRKSKKTTGTMQQLEGIQKYTSRGPNSPVIYAVWVDDALSTGTSLLEGIQLLKNHYNIEVRAALYLVDRSEDRKNLSEEKQKLADPIFENIDVCSVYDLSEVDAQIEVNKKKEKQIL